MQNQRNIGTQIYALPFPGQAKKGRKKRGRRWDTGARVVWNNRVQKKNNAKLFKSFVRKAVHKTCGSFNIHKEDTTTLHKYGLNLVTFVLDVLWFAVCFYKIFKVRKNRTVHGSTTSFWTYTQPWYYIFGTLLLGIILYLYRQGLPCNRLDMLRNFWLLTCYSSYNTTIKYHRDHRVMSII